MKTVFFKLFWASGNRTQRPWVCWKMSPWPKHAFISISVFHVCSQTGASFPKNSSEYAIIIIHHALTHRSMHPIISKYLIIST